MLQIVSYLMSTYLHGLRLSRNFRPSRGTIVGALVGADSHIGCRAVQRVSRRSPLEPSSDSSASDNAFLAASLRSLASAARIGRCVIVFWPTLRILDIRR